MLSEEEFIEIELDTAGGSYLPKESIEYVTKKAKAKYASMVLQHKENLEVREHYELWAYRSIQDIKRLAQKRNGKGNSEHPRATLTVTIPERMNRRLEVVGRGNKSAYVTRLLARGWLSQMEDLE